MTVAASLIPGLDEIVKNGDPKRRAEAARRISELFLQGVAHFRPDHIELFDGVLIGLVPHTELAARADLARRAWRRADADGRPARRSLPGAVERSTGGIDGYRPPPPVRCGQARQAGRDQAGDERYFRPGRTGR